jgi:hypothetical protein
MFNKKGQKKEAGHCKIGTVAEKQGDCTFDALFESEWEVFVIKRDEATGKLVGRTACCALARV